MSQKRPFSLVLPENERQGTTGRGMAYPTLNAALYHAKRFNRSRKIRGLDLLTVLDRNTGTVYTAEPEMQEDE